MAMRNEPSGGIIDARVEWRAFDRLSPPIRAALREVAFDFNAQEVLAAQMQHRIPDDRMAAIIREISAEKWKEEMRSQRIT